jgi:hypothetical protein
MYKVQRFLIINDLSIFGLLILFFIGFIVYDYELIGMKEPFIHLPDGFKIFFEILPWLLFLLLVIDLILKYKLAEGRLEYFLKKYWTDILLTILLPFLFPLKFFKATFKLYKYTKFAKSGYKLYQKYDKIFKPK